MEDIMEILHITRKGNMMNTLEQFQFQNMYIYIYIYNETKLDNQISDK